MLFRGFAADLFSLAIAGYWSVAYGCVEFPVCCAPDAPRLGKRFSTGPNVVQHAVKLSVQTTAQGRSGSLRLLYRCPANEWHRCCSYRQGSAAVELQLRTVDVFAV